MTEARRYFVYLSLKNTCASRKSCFQKIVWSWQPPTPPVVLHEAATSLKPSKAFHIFEEIDGDEQCDAGHLSQQGKIKNNLSIAVGKR